MSQPGVQISVDAEKLRSCKIMIATPMYGGQCAGMFCKSIADLTNTALANGVQLQFYFMFNESLITRARNYCCDEFLRSDCTHLMFIDSDIGFAPNDVLALLAIMINRPDIDVIGGPYPKKCISWEKIKLAVDKGVADQDPRVLENFVGDYVLNPVSGKNEIKIDEPTEVAEIGTGFMMLKRDVLERFREHYPEFSYKPDHVRTEHFDGSREIHAFFDTVIDPDTKRYLSEDYMFCQYVRKMGGTVYICPWMQMAHVGSYVFGGSLRALGAIGAPATASAQDLQKLKKKTKK
jgi:hypothetical protein